MISNFSLFFASMTFSLSQFFPIKRQQFLDILDEIPPVFTEALYSQDILEFGLKNCDAGGILLINTGLFLLGFLLMIAADFYQYRYSGIWSTVIIDASNTIYCYLKFQACCQNQALLILLFIIFWLINGFQWSFAFVFLVLFANICTYITGGNHLC